MEMLCTYTARTLAATQQTALLRAVFEDSSSAIVVALKDFTVLRGNATAHTLLASQRPGRRKEEEEGRGKMEEGVLEMGG